MSPVPHPGTIAMLVLPSCPSVRDLQRLVRSQLEQPEAGPARQHLAECSRCREIHNAFAEEMLPGAAAASEPASSGTWKGGARPSGTVAAVRPAKPMSLVRVTADSTQELLARLGPAEGTDELGRLGAYRLLRQIGIGATGVVFLAEDVHLRRQVALKVMKPMAEGGELARQRFLREGRAAALLESDHVVPIYQVGEEAGMPFLAMKLLVGEALDERLKRDGEVMVHEVLRIGREIAEGLDAAHERGLIHRDIKPANIFLETIPGERGAREPGSRVRLVDFGLARAASEDMNLTRTGTIVGTPAYMSPEQARGARVDFRSDLFSLGCVLYKMCSGRTPFTADDTMGMLVALSQDQPPPLKAFNPNLPDELVGLINSLLAKLPEGRPSSARLVADVLAAIATVAAATSAAGPKVARSRSSWRTVLQVAALMGVGWGAFSYGPALYRRGRVEVERIIEESSRPRGANSQVGGPY